MLRACLLSGALLLAAGCDRVFGLEVSIDAPPLADAPPPPESWLAVDGGLASTCALRRDHTLWCWGRNDGGVLGRGAALADREHPLPVQVGTATDWEAISVVHETACGLRAGGVLACWGRNDDGAIGDGTRDLRPEPVAIAGAWAAVGAGRYHSCAIDTAGALWCWGNGDRGRLGDGLVTTSYVPVQVAATGPFTRVAVGEDHACALRGDSTVWCWGSNDNGRLGVGDAALMRSPVPVQISGGPEDRYVALDVGAQHTCAVRADGRLRCWGGNGSGQLGDRSMSSRIAATPVDEDALVDWTDVRLGDLHTCGLRATGAVLCWGASDRGQLAVATSGPVRVAPLEVPRPADASERFTGLGLGTRHACVIDSAGHLFCAGEAASGALGSGEGSRRTPFAIPGTWSRPVAGEDATCAFADDGDQATCWGSNAQGLLGDGAMEDRQAPGPLLTTPWRTLDLGDHACALEVAPTARRWCWGANNLGQLGDGTTTTARTPTQQTATPWASLVVSRSHSCGITPAGALQCWGRNAERQTGQAAAGNGPILSPAVVAGVWKAAAIGIDFSCGLQTDGRIFCWGYAGWGALGDPARTMTTAIPGPIAGGGTFDAVVAGARHACGLAAGQATCWGWNAFGQLGIGSLVQSAQPVAIPHAWRQLDLGEEHSCGIRADGTLWCWGSNEYGQVGDDAWIDRLDPIQISADADWTSVTAGRRHTCATRASGALYCWGANGNGQLGDGGAWRPALALVR